MNLQIEPEKIKQLIADLEAEANEDKLANYHTGRVHDRLEREFGRDGRASSMKAKKKLLHFRPPAVNFCGSRLGSYKLAVFPPFSGARGAQSPAGADDKCRSVFSKSKTGEPGLVGAISSCPTCSSDRPG